MYIFGVAVGLCSVLRGNIIIGLKRIIHPVGYWRYPVFKLITQYIKKQNNLKVLDIGSPKLIALYFSIIKRFKVYATDIQDPEIFSAWQNYYKDFFLWKKPANRNLFTPEFQDARSLSYPSNYFDLVYSVSVLEHIVGDGDSTAIKEVERVLRPGGTAIIEVPFAIKEYETYLNNDVYERKYIQKPIFYQRHYDSKTIYTRIINSSSKLAVKKIYIFQERVAFEKMLQKIPIAFQIPFLFLSPIVSIINHKKIKVNAKNLMTGKVSNKIRAMDITIIFKKT